jgi:uncharacterized protein (TIGR02118 family)
VIKVVYCIRKKPGLSDEDFFRYWKDVHGPIGARIPGLRKLVQSRRISAGDDAHPADFDGVAELWFDDVASLLTARRSPQWDASTQDELNFIDQRHVAYLVCEENVIVDSRS